MKVIYKYPLDDKVGVQVVKVPASAHFLHAAYQNGGLWIWAQVQTDYRDHDRLIRIYGTGQPIESGGFYICTVHSPDGFVWHIYEE